jgi:O-antigen ligase
VRRAALGIAETGPPIPLPSAAVPAADDVAAGRPPGALSAWWILAGFAAIAALALAGVPATITAGLLLAFLGVATLRHPANGLAGLVLALPFLLGEPKTPYFLLEPVLVGLVLVSFAGHRLRGRVAFAPVPGVALLAFAAAAVIALPLDLRDLVEDLWLLRSLDWPTMAVQGVPDIAHVKFLERVAVLALAAGLLAVAAQPAMGAAVVGALRPLALLVAVLAGFGLLRFFGWVRTTGEFLTLSFWTWQHPDLRLTGVAWNPDYFALFLVLTIPPLLALAVAGGGRAWQRGLAGLAAGVGTVALVFTFQRAAYLALLAALATLAWLARRARVTRGHWAAWLGAAVGVAVAIAALDLFVLDGRVIRRLAGFVHDPNRLRLWQTALRMWWDHPLLGVGTGRYAFFFHEYAGALGQAFGPFWGTAHSLYLHLLAEQGLLGLSSFVALFGGIWLGTFGRLRALPAPRAMLLAGLLAALAGWLVYGLVQFTFRVNALTYFTCLLAGAAVALAPPPPRPAPTRRRALAAVAVGLVLLGVRAEAAWRRPVTPGYEAGFHRWERQPDGGAARWTRGRAATTVPVRGRVLELAFGVPIRDIAARPQQVRVWVDGERRPDLRLTTPDWQRIAVPVRPPVGRHTLVEIEVGYTFVPARLSASRDERRLGVMMREATWRD